MIWLRRVLIGIVALAVLLFVLGNLFNRQIANFAFDRFVERQAGADPSADLPDGLHVYLCGTGSPLPDPSRAGPCIGVLAGQKAFVFDVGSGSVRNMGLMGFPTSRLEAVFLTHLHSDHLDGLGELLLNAWIAGSRDARLPVYGPEGTGDVVDGFNQSYRIDGGFRTAHHGPRIANPLGQGGVALEIETPADPNGSLVVFGDGDVLITAIQVAHSPVHPAFGFRVDYKDRSVSISGDTIYSEGFVSGSNGVDIMFHEALDPEMVGKIGEALADRGQIVGAKIFSDIPDYHATPEDAARAADAASAGQLVFYHAVPPLPARQLEVIFLGDVKKLYSGPVTVGRDGTLFSLPAGSDKIIRKTVF
ncbi:MAG: MBL fold metallo-hydrolase [Pseudomonadota bacterium]